MVGFAGGGLLNPSVGTEGRPAPQKQRKCPKPKDNGGNQRDPEVRCGSARA